MSSFYGTKGWRSYDMHSLTYNDQKNKVHAHLGMTNYTKDGYTQPGSAKGTLNSNFDGSGKRSSYPSKSWDFDINKRWNLGDHTILLGDPMDRIDLIRPFTITSPTGNLGTVLIRRM